MIKSLLLSSIYRIPGMGRFFYAVRRGRKTGVFMTWDECKLQVNGFAGARYKKFGTEEEAWGFVNTNDGVVSSKAKVAKPSLVTSAKHLAPSCTQTVSGLSPLGYKKRLYCTDAQTEDLPSSKRQRRRAPSTVTLLSETESDLVVYTDGACTHNGRRGAKAGVGVYWGDGHPLNHSARLEGKQTNQRAELTAALRALEQVKEHHSNRSVTLFTDSKYTIQCVTTWIHNWKRNGWKTSQKTDVLNKEDLVKLDKLNSQLNIKWEYVPGHQNIYGNEKADGLAREGASMPLPAQSR